MIRAAATKGNPHQVVQANRAGFASRVRGQLPHRPCPRPALVTSTPEGKTAYLSADLRDGTKILAAAAETLDLSQPVALLFLMTLEYVPDPDDPHAIVRGYLDALASGSFLVVSDTIMEGDDAVLAESARRMNQGTGGRVTQTRRPLPEFARFLEGLELLDPGIVPLNRWRPGPDEPVFDRDIPAVAGLARKP